MLVSDIFSYVRNRSNTNSVTANDTSLYLYLNERHRQLWLALQNAREDYNGEISTTDLIGSQQEYPLPDESMKIKRIEVMYDGVHWTPMKIFDINERQGRPSDQTSVNNDFSTGDPYVDVYDSSLFLFPFPTNNSTISDGLKLWFIRRPQNIAVTNVSPELPKEYHIYLVDLMSLDVEVSRGRMSVVQAEQAAKGIMDIFQGLVSPRKLGENVRMRTRKKNMR